MCRLPRDGELIWMWRHLNIQKAWICFRSYLVSCSGDSDLSITFARRGDRWLRSCAYICQARLPKVASRSRQRREKTIPPEYKKGAVESTSTRVQRRETLKMRKSASAPAITNTHRLFVNRGENRACKS